MDTMPMVDPVATGKRIKNLRKQAGMKVSDMQNVLGFGGPNAIYKWQRGDAMPTLDNLVVLAAIFQVRIDDIIVVAK